MNEKQPSHSSVFVGACLLSLICVEQTSKFGTRMEQVLCPGRRTVREAMIDVKSIGGLKRSTAPTAISPRPDS